MGQSRNLWGFDEELIYGPFGGSLPVVILMLTSWVIDELQRGLWSELSEVGGDKMPVESKFTLTLLPQPQISHKSSEDIAQAHQNAPYRSGFVGLENCRIYRLFVFRLADAQSR